MAEVTVKQLAEQVGMPVERLLTQFHEAGMPISDENKIVSDADRSKLLDHIGNASAPKLTLQRKSKVEPLACLPAFQSPGFSPDLNLRLIDSSSTMKPSEKNF